VKPGLLPGAAAPQSRAYFAERILRAAAFTALKMPV
jgi:hypothetical protein